MFVLTYVSFYFQSVTSIYANDGLLEGVPYIISSTAKEAEAPYQMCLNENLIQFEAGTWVDRKTKAKKEGTLLYHKKQIRYLDFSKEEKKIRMNQNNDLMYSLNLLSSNKFEDVYLGIEDKKEEPEARYLLFHFKPRNVMVLFYFYGTSILGFDMMTATAGNFTCVPVPSINKK